MKNLKMFFCIAVLLCAFVGAGFAADKKGSSTPPRQPAAGSGPFSTLMNINNISMWISYDGASARNPSTGNSGVTYPRGTSTSIYADGFLWGGLVHDGGSQILRVNGGTYQQGNVGGRIISKGVAESQGDPSVRIYRIRRDYKTADLRQDAAELLTIPLQNVSQSDIDAVRAQYEKDWNEWPANKGAPFYDKDANGVYDPAIDEPGVADADQVIWFVINDLNSAQSQSFEGSDPMGMEVQVTLWAYARSATDQLGNVIFKKYKFLYKGTASGTNNAYIDSMYIGQWADPDLGDYSDDYEGCDTTRTTSVGTTTNLGFVYNSTTLDRNYNAFSLPPPAMGYDFFAGPMVPSPGDSAVFDLQYRHGYKNLGMSSWIYFAASGTYSDPDFNYVGAGQWYNLLRGLTPVDGSPFTFPGNTEPTKFWLSGDPVAGTGNLDGTIDPPGDRRMMLSTGPFRMTLGDTQEVVVAMVGGIGADRLSSVTVLRYNDLGAQYGYDVLFDLPKAPPAPRARIGEFDKSLLIDWGFDDAAVQATEHTVIKGYEFQGYNVYQLPSASATVDQGVKLATFDVIDNVTTILDNTLDPASGQVLQKPSQIGKNTGVRHYLKVDRDFLRDKPLVDGRSYYFAVTAYNNNSSGTVIKHTYETPLQIIRGVPQSPNPGDRYVRKTEDSLTATHSGPSDGSVIPIVIDPSKMTGDTYLVRFRTDSTGTTYWTLHDVSKGTDVLSDQTNQAGDDNYAFVDGLQVKVLGPKPGMKEWAIPNGARRFSPVNGFAGLGLEGFSSAADPTIYDENAGTIGMAGHLAFGGIGTTLTNTDYHTVLLKLAAVDPGTLWDPLAAPTDTNFSKGYRWLRRASDPPQDPSFGPWIIHTGSGYPYQDFNYSVPFSAWDMETNPPTRLAVGMFENNVPGGLVDGRYWPYTASDATDNTVAREFCFIFNKPYSTTPDPAFETNLSGNASLPMEWVMVCSRRNSNPWEAGDEFEILASHVNSPADTFSFQAVGKTQNSALAKTDVEKINVFPNPYYGYNAMETSRFSRFITFNHLPPGDWNIRIVSLSGNLVRFIEPSQTGQDPTKQFATWDLSNQHGLPVASGIYVAYIDMPKLGVTKTLKIAVIQEQQVLDYY